MVIDVLRNDIQLHRQACNLFASGVQGHPSNMTVADSTSNQ